MVEITFASASWFQIIGMLMLVLSIEPVSIVVVGRMLVGRVLLREHERVLRDKEETQCGCRARSGK